MLFLLLLVLCSAAMELQRVNVAAQSPNTAETLMKQYQIVTAHGFRSNNAFPADIRTLWPALPNYSPSAFDKSVESERFPETRPITEVYETRAGGLYYVVHSATSAPGSDNEQLYFLSRFGAAPVLRLSGTSDNDRILGISFEYPSGGGVFVSVTRAVNGEIRSPPDLWSIDEDRLAFKGLGSFGYRPRRAAINDDCSDRTKSATGRSLPNLTIREHGLPRILVPSQEAAVATYGLLGQRGIFVGCQATSSGFLAWVYTTRKEDNGVTFRIDGTGHMTPVFNSYPDPASQHYLFFGKFIEAGVIHYNLVHVKRAQ